MATATGAKPKTFNYDLFRKRVRLFDSDRDGERELAIQQALRQCAESEPPLHFWEAAGAAFGGADTGERERLEERAARAEAEAEDERRNAAEQTEINDRLREEIARLSETRDPDDYARGEWPDTWLLQPNPLLAMLAILLVCEWTAVTPLGHTWLGRYAATVSEWIHAFAMALFVVRSFAVYRRKGGRELAFDWIAWGSGWVLTAWVIGLTYPAFMRSFFFRQMFVPYCWWATMGVTFRVGTFWIVFAALAFVIDLILGLPVSRWIVGRIAWAIALLRQELEQYTEE